MILYRWQGAASNFGDELNTLLWPRLLPGFFDDNPAVRFLGIGSVLDQRHPNTPVKLVAGSGYGGYESKPRLDRNWVIQWVRGPRTAAILGLPHSLALGDPAALVPQALSLPPRNGNDIGFMPHFESAARGDWRQATERAGMQLIDPRDPPLAILRAIGQCKLLLSEALHGVIIADAMRVPWVAIRPLARVHRAKWSDWADTMNLRPRFQSLPASTLAEWAGASPLGCWHTTRAWLGQQQDRLERLTPERLVVRASRALARAADVEPQLSSRSVLDRCQSRMLDAVHALSVNPWQVASCSVAPRASVFPLAGAPPQRLHASAETAYQLTAIG